MKSTHILPLLLLACTIATAQENRRFWSDGPLTWSDFRTTMSPDGTHSHIRWELGYEINKGIVADDGIPCDQYKAVAWMDLSQSWVDANQRTDLVLRFNRLVFDLLEVERRQLARTLASCSHSACLTATLNAATASLDNTLRSLHAATAGGTDESALVAWEQHTRRRLDTLTDDAAPHFELQPLSLALTLGIALRMPTSALADIYSDGLGMQFGIELGWRRHIFTSEALVAGTHLREPMWFQDNEGIVHQLEESDPASAATGAFTYGFRVLETRRQSLTPMLGWSWSTLTLFDGTARGSIGTNGPALGIAYRHHFWQRYRLPGSLWALMNPQGAELSRWSIEARLLAARHSYEFSNADRTGWTLQLSLGIAFGGRSAR